MILAIPLIAGLSLIPLYLLYKFVVGKRMENFPPGPKGYPYIGAIPLVQSTDARMPVALMKIGEKYTTNILGIFLGRYPNVITTGWDASQEVLSREEFDNRPDLFLHRDFWGNRPLGIGLTNGEFWKNQRGFCMSVLKETGTQNEGMMQEELADLVRYLKTEAAGNPDSSVSMQDAFLFPVVNILWTLFSGKHHFREDLEFQKMIVALEAFFRSGIGFASLINDYPLLRFSPPFSNEYKSVIGNHKAVNVFLKAEIEKHKLEIKSNQANPTNMIDKYLIQMEAKKQENSNESLYFSDDQLIAIIGDCFFAGVETLSNALAFGVLYMLSYPEIQEKVHGEISSTLKQRSPSVLDKQNLPYTQAVMAELLRMTAPATLSVPHCTVKDTTLKGFNIPKDIVVSANIYSVHNEVSYWGDPEKFRPDRFLDPSGTFIEPTHVIPFSMGNRSCFGESVARTVYFIFMAGFIQNFKIEAVPGEPKPTLEPIPRLTEAPRPFNAKLSPRV